LQSNDSNLIAYAASSSGHSPTWLKFFRKFFCAEVVYGPLRGILFKRLFQENRLLITMLDSNMIAFACLVGARSLFGKRTVAFFFRPQSCFESTLKSLVKRWLLIILKLLPNFTIITIIPFDILPDYARVAHAGVYDLQYWDLNSKRRQLLPQTALSKKIEEIASGRPVVCALGSLNSSKGMRFMAEILKSRPSIAENVLWIHAGQACGTESQLAERLRKSGVLVVSRYMTEVEFMSLYGAASAIWACYAPNYDQASGIFGRAIQLGVPAIIRRGSVNHRLAELNDIKVITVDYNDTMEVTATHLESTLAQLKNKNGSSEAHAALFSLWRKHFFETVNNAL